MRTPERISSPDLASLFAGLPLPGGDWFSASPVPGAETHRIARSARDEACLLVHVAGASEKRPPAVELQHLRVLYDVQCRVVDHSGSERRDYFTVVAYTSDDLVMRAQFLEIVAPLVVLLGAEPRRCDVADRLDALVRLFQASPRPAAGSAQGLWAELFLIANAADPIAMLRAWRAGVEDRFDFGDGSQRIEVKSAAGGSRQHHVSFEQVRPAAGTDVVVASLMVERAGGGTSLGELLDEVRQIVSRDLELLLHLESTVMATLGEGLAHALPQRFDRERAAQTLRFFDALDVPSVAPPLPEGVSQLRFVSDLGQVRPIDSAEYIAKGGLFAAALRA